ncbi:MAG: Stf0 family sulfotransferase [Gaiellaceae bacterium]
MKRPRLFVILTTQRSGSGWLVDLLNDHPEIVTYGEMFRVTDTTIADYGATTVPRFEVMVPTNTFSTSASLASRRYDYVRGLARAHPEARAVGFKLMYDQTRDHPGLMGALVLARASFVHLIRRDYLSALISFDIAFDRDRWHYHEGDDVPRVRVHADPGELLRRLDERDSEITQFRRRLSRLPVRVCELAYEDLREQRDDVLREVLQFLGVRPVRRPLRSPLVPTSPTSGLDALENRDDVVAALSGTRYASMAGVPEQRVTP